MAFRRTSSVLYILFIFYLQHNLLSVSSRPPSVDTNHETLPFNPSETDVVGFEGKTRELAVVIKKAIGGGRVIYPARSHFHRSSGSMNLRGGVCAVGWLCSSVLAGLFLILNLIYVRRSRWNYGAVALTAEVGFWSWRQRSPDLRRGGFIVRG
ncbi:BnaC08g46480D [Brassica napus]|uniref:(rape) hypothetical protein n=1 Tax=Brassica napus TaxID=3708 RepID=A0A078JNE0_BRANA|nr:unnamed protein product [Brassica napus]CDY69063.1 BnaC08g46480D [Brassica napus]